MSKAGAWDTKQKNRLLENSRFCKFIKDQTLRSFALYGAQDQIRAYNLRLVQINKGVSCALI